jgi:hypothetical protein
VVGQNFLPSPFGASSRIAFEIAWTADITADPATWTWSDITTDVFQDPGVSISFGRGDEASVSQPARCSFVVGNRSGAYSKGGESSNWPNVRAGVPVRVRVDPDGLGFVDPPAFQGYAVGFPPDWSLRGNDARVQVDAAGALRRLSQGQSPVQSSLRRGIPMTDGILAYWPCEDGPEAGGFAPAVGPYFMSWYGDPKLASSAAFASSAPIPVLSGSVWAGSIAASPATGEVHARFIAEFPGSTAPDEGVLLTILTSGTAARYDLVYVPGGGGFLTVVVYDGFGSLITFHPTGVGFNIDSPPLARRYSLTLTQNGSNIDITFGTVDAETADDSGFGSMTVNSRTLGVPITALVNGAGSANPAGALDQVAYGHLAVYDADPGYYDNLNELVAFRGERADHRLERLCAENGETIDITGIAPITMGAQSIATLLDLLRECETADDGVLYDGRGVGLSYVCRSERENQDADLTINASGSQLAPGFAAVDDDQRRRNKATVTRTAASESTYEDTDGPLGTAVIGVYDTSLSVNLQEDFDAIRYAEWIVHVGTQDGYRYPAVPVDVRRAPTLARPLLELLPADRADATGIATVLRSFPSSGDVRLVVEGVEYRISDSAFTANLKCSGYEPWRIDTTNPAASGAAIELVGSRTTEFDANTTGSSAFLTIDLPPQARVGDLVLAFVSIRNSGAGTCPAPDGWTMFKQSGNASVYGKYIEAGDIDINGVFAIGIVETAGGVANATVALQAFVVRGTHPEIGQVLHASAEQLNASAANIAYPGVTITAANCMAIVAGWKQDDWTSVAAIAGMTELFDASSTLGDDAGQVVDYVIQTTAANIASGSFTVTGGASAISRGITLALAPAPAPDEPFRLDTDGSTLAASIAAGATSISVQTTAAGPISYVGIGAMAVGSNASLTPALPTGLAQGDLVVAVVAIRNSGTGTVNVPDLWFTIKTSGNLSVLGHYYQPGDTDPTFTFTGGVANATTQAQLFALRGVNPLATLVLNNSAAQLNASAQNIAIPGLVASHDDVTMVVIGWKQDDWTSVAQLSGQFFTEISDSPTLTGDDAGIEIQYRLGGFVNAATFSTTSFTVTGGASAISRSMVLAFEPSSLGLWTTAAGDYPIDLDVGGVKLTATACADVKSPQTMTISAAPVARNSGVPVKLWVPPVLGR